MAATDKAVWTIEALKEHVDLMLQVQAERFRERVEDSNRAVASALASADRAVSKAEAAAEKRFESVNEFRGALSDQAKSMMTRAEVDAALGVLREKIEGLNGLANRLENFIGRGTGQEAAEAKALAQRNWMVGLTVTTFISLLTAAIAVAGLIFRG
jgi:hypothetical protein